MSVVADILAELSNRGVTVRADGEILRLKPRAALEDDLLARVQANKPDILAALSSRPATCTPTCYEIEPGKCIHHPWDGCKTPVPSREPYVPSRADCGCDGPVCSRCFLCSEHCHCRLDQVGVEAAPESKAGASTTKCQNTEGGSEIK